MNLQTALYESAAIFALSFGGSLFKRINETEDKVKICEEISDGLRDISPNYKKLSLKARDTKRVLRQLSIALPLCIGVGSHSLLSILANQRNPENIFFTLPSAFAGYWAGKGCRYLKRKSIKKQIQDLEKASTNPDTIKGYLTDRQRQTIESSLESIEQNAYNGTHDPHNSYELTAIYDALTHDVKIHTPLLVRWSAKRVAEAVEGGTFRKEVRDFYETELPKADDSYVVACNPIGRLSLDKNLVIFIRQGNKLYLEEIASIYSTTKPLSEEQWGPGRNYTEFANRIRETGKDRNTILMYTSESCPTEVKELILQTIFMEEVAKSSQKSHGVEDE